LNGNNTVLVNTGIQGTISSNGCGRTRWLPEAAATFSLLRVALSALLVPNLPVKIRTPNGQFIGELFGNPGQMLTGSYFSKSCR
jgi:hypothetical protein